MADAVRNTRMPMWGGMMKIIIGKDYCSSIYVDTENRFNLGPFEFVVVGDHEVGGYIDGRFSLIQYPKHRVERLNKTRERPK